MNSRDSHPWWQRSLDDSNVEKRTLVPIPMYLSMHPLKRGSILLQTVCAPRSTGGARNTTESGLARRLPTARRATLHHTRLWKCGKQGMLPTFPQTRLRLLDTFTAKPNPRNSSYRYGGSSRNAFH